MPPDSPPPLTADLAVIRAVRDTLLAHRQIIGPAPLEEVYVAFSGGMDSTALLLAVCELAESERLEVTALHAKHGLQAEDGEWAAHCQKVCHSAGARLRIAELKVETGNMEAEARRARYQFFAQQLPPGGLLLLAHHAEDQTETVLQRILSGRGVLPMRSSGECGSGRFARPLLHTKKSLLTEYLRDFQSGPDWIEDPSNTDQRLDRNFLRHGVLPLLRKRWPQLDSHVERVASSVVGLQQAMAVTLTRFIEKDGPNSCVSRHLVPESRLVAREWFRQLSMVFAGRGFSDRSFDEFWRQDEEFCGDNRVLRVDEAHEIRLAGDQLYLLCNTNVTPRAQLVADGSVLAWRYGELQVKQTQPRERLSFPMFGDVEVRPRQGGEVVAGEDGRKVVVKTLLHDARVPAWLRRDYPLVYCNQQLVCVPDVWVCQPVADAENTDCQTAWLQVSWG